MHEDRTDDWMTKKGKKRPGWILMFTVTYIITRIRTFACSRVLMGRYFSRSNEIGGRGCVGNFDICIPFDVPG